MTRQSRQLRRLVVTCSLLQRFETVICAPVGAPLADWAGLVLLKLAVRLHTGQRVGRRGRRPAPAGSTRRSNAVIFRGRLEPACHAIQTVYTDRRTRAYTRARRYAIRDIIYACGAAGDARALGSPRRARRAPARMEVQVVKELWRRVRGWLRQCPGWNLGRRRQTDKVAMHVSWQPQLEVHSTPRPYYRSCGYRGQLTSPTRALPRSRELESSRVYYHELKQPADPPKHFNSASVGGHATDYPGPHPSDQPCSPRWT